MVNFIQIIDIFELLKNFMMPLRQMKRSSVKPWIENVGETVCLKPAFNQITNDDDDELE